MQFSEHNKVICLECVFQLKASRTAANGLRQISIYSTSIRPLTHWKTLVFMAWQIEPGDNAVKPTDDPYQYPARGVFNQQQQEITMTTQQKTIKGVIAFDVNTKEYSFKDYLEESDFVDGSYQTDYSNYVFVANHEITFSLPDGLDTVGPQIKALDAKEKELTLQYNQALHHIQVQRNNLLAIEQ